MKVLQQTLSLLWVVRNRKVIAWNPLTYLLLVILFFVFIGMGMYQGAKEFIESVREDMRWK